MVGLNLRFLSHLQHPPPPPYTGMLTIWGPYNIYYIEQAGSGGAAYFSKTGHRTENLDLSRARALVVIPVKVVKFSSKTFSAFKFGFF